MRLFGPLLLIFCLLAACETDVRPPNVLPLIPWPAQLEVREGVFLLDENTRFLVPPGDAMVYQLASQLAQKIRQASGFPTDIRESQATSPELNTILLRLDEQIEQAEGYSLSVGPQGILIKGKDAAGLFYGLQTLRQLLPVALENATTPPRGWLVPCIEIKDAPRFAYRGMHLDVSRHFFPVEDVKRYLDLMALHKFNTFHWHLTDDQGWRIEIKQYPRLTSVGAWRNETLIGHASERPAKYDGKRYGGFYTQQEILEVVAYAADRQITIIPEIEMPGHALAALAAYPQLACSNGPFEVARDWGVFEDVYCPTEETFTFLQNVLTEVTGLFPGPYIHIGGDECPKASWENSRFCQRLMREKGLRDANELQSYFIRRIDTFLHEKGRKMIGWDEILEGGLSPHATVMSWRGMQGGITAAQQGHDVIMTPGAYCYFDAYQGDPAQEPLAIGGNLSVEKVYQFEPRPDTLSAEAAAHIIGAQGNVWTEYIALGDHLQYMVWPRAAALAEVLWSADERRDWEDFASRVERYLPRLDAMNTTYALNMFGVTMESNTLPGAVELQFSSLAARAKIHYRTDGGTPDPKSPEYKEPLRIEQDSRLRAAAFLNGAMLGNVLKRDYLLHKAVGVTIQQEATYSPAYSAGGDMALVDGLQGSESHSDGFWQGYEGQNMEVVLDLGHNQPIKAVNLHFLYHPDSWILLPRRVEVLVSQDGQRFEPIRDVSYPYRVREAVAPRREELLTEVDDLSARYIKVVAYAVRSLPSWHPGSGSPAWMFIDEIIVR